MIRSSTPAPGSADAGADAPITISFSLPADETTLTATNLVLAADDGEPVSYAIVFESFNTSTVRLVPAAPLTENRAYRVTVGAGVRGRDGAGTLGAASSFCFMTRSATPTVRPDQIVDLGDVLNAPHYLGATVTLPDGRTLVMGGYASASATTAAIEIWNPQTRRFVFAPVALRTPRAEFSVTVLQSGEILIAGGVGTPGGVPLASTELLAADLASIAVGPPLQEPRRSHAASRFRLDGALLSGGFDAAGERMTSIEVFDGTDFALHTAVLPTGTAEHAQFAFEFDRVYFTPGNLIATAAVLDGLAATAHLELDPRLRAASVRIDSERIFTVGGDSRTAATYVHGEGRTIGATDLLRERRGAHSLTRRAGAPHRYLVAGGFNVARIGTPALANLELVDFRPVGANGDPDAVFHFVENVTLPVPFAGHSGFVQADGSTVLAGGFGSSVGPHSRRVVLVLDGPATPPVICR